MIIWTDAQLSPQLAAWIGATFGVEARAVREIGLQRARDREIYEAARIAGAVLMTKDVDFLDLLQRYGPPPQILWVTCGNTSNTRLKQVFDSALPTAIGLLERGEALVEISDAE